MRNEIHELPDLFVVIIGVESAKEIVFILRVKIIGNAFYDIIENVKSVIVNIDLIAPNASEMREFSFFLNGFLKFPGRELELLKFNVVSRAQGNTEYSHGHDIIFTFILICTNL